MGPKRRKRLACLFCQKKVVKEIRNCSKIMFDGCFRHLPSIVIGDKKMSWEKFKENEGPFCDACFESAKMLSNKHDLLTTMENDMQDFIKHLTDSILLNRISPVTAPFFHKSKMEIQVAERVDIEPLPIPTEEHEVLSPATLFDCYEEEVHAVDVQDSHDDSYGQEVHSVEELPQGVILEQEVELIEETPTESKQECLLDIAAEEETRNTTVTTKTSHTTMHPQQPVMKKIVLQKSPSGKLFVMIPCACGESFENGDEMNAHLLICPARGKIAKSSDVRYRCGVCGFLAKTVEELANHKKKHLKAYACKKCGMKFKFKHILREHLKTHKLSDPGYKCSFCGKAFLSKRVLNLHEEKHEGNNEVVESEEEESTEYKRREEKRQCELCGFVCGSKTHLNYHILSKHSDSFPFECTMCSRKFKLRRFLDVHMQTHMTVKSYLCAHPTCGKSFSRDVILRDHMKLEHSDEHFKCELCGFKTLIEKRLTYHNLHYHDESKPYMCDICSLRVNSKSSLQNHRRIHTGEKPFTCECGETFRTSVLLKIHKNTRHAVGTFKCQLCDYVAGTRNILISHSLVHSDEKAFNCEGCGKGYKSKTSMVKHARLFCKILNK